MISNIPMCATWPEETIHDKFKLIRENNYFLVMDASIQHCSYKLITFNKENGTRLNKHGKVCSSESRFTHLCNCLRYFQTRQFSM